MKGVPQRPPAEGCCPRIGVAVHVRRDRAFRRQRRGRLEEDRQDNRQHGVGHPQARASETTLQRQEQPALVLHRSDIPEIGIGGR